MVNDISVAITAVAQQGQPSPVAQLGTRQLLEHDHSAGPG
jgi:hypothetical protein